MSMSFFPLMEMMRMFGTGNPAGGAGGSGAGLQGYELFRQAQQQPELAQKWNQMLAPFGQQVNMHPEANPIFHQLDTGQGFIGHHPGIFGRLQNALLGAALTRPATDAQGNPVPEGAGAGLARAITGGMSVQPYIENYIGQRFMAPFAQASAQAGLKFPQEYMNLIQKAAADKTNADLSRIDATAPRVNPVTGGVSTYNPTTHGWGAFVGGFPHGKAIKTEDTLQGPLVTYADGTQTLNGQSYTGQGATPIPKNVAALRLLANKGTGPASVAAKKALQQMDAQATALRSTPHITVNYGGRNSAVPVNVRAAITMRQQEAEKQINQWAQLANEYDEAGDEQGAATARAHADQIRLTAQSDIDGIMSKYQGGGKAPAAKSVPSNDPLGIR